MGLRVTGKVKRLSGRRDLNIQATLAGQRVRRAIQASDPRANPIPAIKAAQEQFWNRVTGKD